MKILGVDYGRKKIGLAISDGDLAQPLRVLSVNSREEAFAKVLQVMEIEKIDRVVVGISEGEMAEEIRDFTNTLGTRTSTLIKTFDETLTSQDAQRLSQEAGINRKKRLQMEDAYAAALMLQNYLDFS